MTHFYYLYNNSEPYEEQTIVSRSLKITPELLKQFCILIDEIHSSRSENYYSLTIEAEYDKKQKQTITYKDTKIFLDNLKLRNLSRLSISYYSTNRRIWIYISMLIESTILIGDNEPTRLRGLIRRYEEILEENDLKINSFVNSKKAWGLYLIISVSLVLIAIILLPTESKYLGLLLLGSLTWWPQIFPAFFPRVETPEMTIVMYRKRIFVAIVTIISLVAGVLAILQFLFPST